MAQQSLNMIQQNPQMLESAIRMMNSDPEMRRNLIENVSNARGGGETGPAGASFDADTMRRQLAMMQALNGGMGAGGGMAPSPSTHTNAPGPNQMGGSENQNSGANAGGASGGDSDMTEEQMIAEAIARSLRES